MNVYELAEQMDSWASDVYGGGGKTLTDAANMLRQQAERIERKQELIREQTALLAKLNNRIAELEKQTFFIADSEKQGDPIAWMLADKKNGHIRSIMAVQHDFVPQGCVEIPLYTSLVFCTAPQIKPLSDGIKLLEKYADKIEDERPNKGLSDVVLECVEILKKASAK
jgi:hypothetical protein